MFSTVGRLASGLYGGSPEGAKLLYTEFMDSLMRGGSILFYFWTSYYVISIMFHGAPAMGDLDV